MKLVILESPNKTKTVKQYLNRDDYLVLSCNGHINDLAKTGDYGLGIDLKTFTPIFLLDLTKKAILQTLKKFAKTAETIYLATDPDREGEAISYHLANYLTQPQKIKRIVFNEITKQAILKSFENPTKINQNLVESQITRRLLDRIIGFRLSQFLQKTSSGKTAGRVQSVSLKLIVKLEEEIRIFVPQKSWILSALFLQKYNFKLTHQIVTPDKVVPSIKKPKLKKVTIKSEKELKTLKAKLSSTFEIVEITKDFQARSSPLPLNTANLVQLAFEKFKFSVKKTMALAQQLYEGVEFNDKLVAFITYPRSDSRRVSQDFYQKMSQIIKKKYGKEYLADDLQKKIVNKTAQIKIQDAHESIHIIDPFLNLAAVQAKLSDDLFKLYSLIYHYSFASLMTNAKIATTKILLNNGSYQWQFIQEKVVFAGYGKILSIGNLTNQKLEIPINWKVSDKIRDGVVSSELKVSKPKVRYNEGKLIKTLEKLGIGRPSTYAVIVPKLISSGYLIKEEGYLVPTELGFLVNESLVSNFLEIINEEYTAKLEKALDKIAHGKEKRVLFLKKFYDFFQKRLKKAKSGMEKLLEKDCPQCQKKLQEKIGRYGKFVACSGYPECRYIEKTPLPGKDLNRACPQCQKTLQEKEGRYGKFVACSGYPECRYIEKTPLPGKNLDRTCPRCQKTLQEKEGRYGKFIACSGYPECRYIEKTPLPGKDLDRACPRCQKTLQEKKGRYGKFIACSGYPQCLYREYNNSKKN